MRIRMLLAALVVLAGMGVLVPRFDGASPGGTRAGGVTAVDLVAFSSCAELEAWRDDASRGLALAAPDSVEDGGGASGESFAAPPPPGTDVAAVGEPTPRATAEPSGTNNQVAGVDEADLVKTDGRRVVGVRTSDAGAELWVVDAEAATAPLVVPLGDLDARALLLRDGRAFVIAQRGAGTVAWAHEPAARDIGGVAAPEADRVEVIDVDLGGAPRELGRRAVEGWYVEGRMTADAIRVVVSSPGGSNGRVLPQVWDSDGAGAPVASCDEVAHPVTDPSSPPPTASLATTTVVTIAAGLDDWTTTSIASTTDVVYATASTLYLGAAGWDEAGEHTVLHAFATEGAAPARHVASARVAGRLLNQYALDEHEGVLRVALTRTDTVDDGCGPIEPTTVGPAPGIVADVACRAPRTTNEVLTLRVDGDRLVEAGRIGDLGVGEEIKAVRYLGDTAYVVTFRQTDPLYVLDLADPARPSVLGELKMPGFSSYLHPLGDGRLLGAGSDADPMTGMVTGAKVSLYDATDPLAPAVIADLLPPDAQLLVASDPRAFSWDAARSTALLPYGPWVDRFDDTGLDPGGGTREPGAGGVLVVGVTAEGLVERARLTDPLGDQGWAGDGPTRAFVVGSRVVTASAAGLGLYDADALTRLAWLPFA